MKTVGITLGTIAVAVLLVAAGAWLGSIWRQDRWGDALIPAPAAMRFGGGTMMGDYAPQGAGGTEMPCDQAWQGYGTGMMGGVGPESCREAYVQPGGEVASLQEAQAAVEAYVDQLGYENLHVAEIMAFERNYYAIVAEDESGVGAMELLVDADSGAVGPEPGPNMMWNARYGMHDGRGMMGGHDPAGEMVLTPDEAQQAAQAWLDANFPGRSAGEADPFYGYYTFHFLKDGEIEGMLSVHGGSGQVWHHSWHGEFIAMTGEHD